ncbi:MAG: hypothetical protein J2P16_00010 [Mycobacterium sp.]|nr:hypothetical protein [Mycobacterium sp.]
MTWAPYDQDLVHAVLTHRLVDDAERCPAGHKLAEWFDDGGRPLRRTEAPYVVETKRCPACDAVELAKNRPGSDKDDPAVFYVLAPRQRDEADDQGVASVSELAPDETVSD